MSTATQTVETPRVASLAELRPKSEPVQNLPAISVGLTSLQGFELAQRAAKLLAASTIVPKAYQGNIPNCVVAINMAARIGADPLMVMQNIDVVHGRPAWRAKFLISTVNTCGRFSALRYEFFGEQGKDSWGCRAWSIEKATGERLNGPDISIKLAKEEGWYDRNGTKWKSIPQKMLMYRAGAWWSDLYAPELAMGLRTVEEEADIIDATLDEKGNYSVNLSDLRGANINVETGDIIDAEPQDKPAKEPELAATAFDINVHNLKTQAGIKDAVKALCAQLEQVPAEERAAMFLQNSGREVVSAVNRAGLGQLKQRFEDIGINLTPTQE